MKGLLLSVIVEGIRSRKDHTVAVTLGTQELSQGQAGELFNFNSKLCAVYISPKEGIDQKEIDQVDKLDVELGGKTQSQRIRNVLFKLYDQNAEGFKEFDSFYKAKTEAIIEHFKTKINP
jgi:hypothetical protein